MIRKLYVLLALSALAPLGAQAPTVTVERIDCLPRGANGVVYADAAQEVGGSSLRLFFKWDQDSQHYWVLMNAMGNGRYWGVPPQPDEVNEAVEYYAAMMDAEERVLAASEILMAPVREECDFNLTEKQLGEAENLTVGETSPDQAGEEVEGFLCQGIVSRVNARGVLRGDERCRACVIR